MCPEQLPTRTAFNLIRCTSTATGGPGYESLHPSCTPVVRSASTKCAHHSNEHVLSTLSTSRTPDSSNGDVLAAAVRWVRSWRRIDEPLEQLTPATSATLAFSAHSVLNALDTALQDPAVCFYSHIATNCFFSRGIMQWKPLQKRNSIKQNPPSRKLNFNVFTQISKNFNIRRIHLEIKRKFKA